MPEGSYKFQHSEKARNEAKIYEVATACPLPCISKEYLKMVEGRINSYQRHLGDVARIIFQGNYPSTSGFIVKHNFQNLC